MISFKKVKHFVIVTFLLVSFNTFSQEAEKENKTIEEIKNLITFSLISPTVYSEDRTQLGYYRKLKNRFFVGADIGFGSDDTIEAYPLKNKNHELLEIRPEIYFSLNDASHKLKRLLSLEFFHIKHQAQFQSYAFREVTNEDKLTYYDSADYERVKYGVNCNYNVIYHLGKRLSLMQSLGLGVKNRIVSFNNVKNPRIEEQNDGESWFPVFKLFNFGGKNYLFENGKSLRMNFYFDLKLVIKL